MKRSLFLGTFGNRPAVAEGDLLDVPAAAGRAAAQRPDLQLYLVAGLQAPARPSAACHVTRASAFEVPGLDGAVLLLDRKDDEGVRVSEIELLDHAFELDRVVPIEHREG